MGIETIRCVIAGIPQNLLADIVQSVAEESGVIEVVDRVNSVADIPAVLSRLQVDVLILGMKNIVLPNLDFMLKGCHSELPIVGLGDDGRRLAVYLDNAGKDEILNILSALRRPGREVEP